MTDPPQLEPGSLENVEITPWLHPLSNKLSDKQTAGRDMQTPRLEAGSLDSFHESERRVITSLSNHSSNPIDSVEDFHNSEFVFAEFAGNSIQKSRPRKGHTKSRAGCFNCKRRKVKCQENRPSCYNCIRKEVTCVYPVPKTASILHAIENYANPNPVPSINMQATPTVFTMTDMRLFHHYLQEAYPYLPISNDKTWLSQVPLIAHQNEYLMYGLLGLAASHLAALTGDNLEGIAIQYRLRAIQGFNEAISKKLQTGNDGDATLGCAYLLTFQSTYMNDGFEDFFQFVRGCHVIAEQIQKDNLPSNFYLDGKDHFAEMRPRLLNLPDLDPELLNGAATSLSQMSHLLHRPSHFPFHNMLVECIDAAKASSLQAYCKFVCILKNAPTLDAETFQDLTDPQNDISRVLIAHFVAIQMVFAPVVTRGWSHRKMSIGAHSNQWVFSIYNLLPNKLKEFCLWPKSISEAVEEELSFAKAMVPRISLSKVQERMVMEQ